MLELAQRVGRAKPSMIMVIAQKARQLKATGRNIISFSVSVPNFLPGEHVYAAARETLAHDSGQYGGNCGSDMLQTRLQHIAEFLPSWSELVAVGAHGVRDTLRKASRAGCAPAPTHLY